MKSFLYENKGEDLICKACRRFCFIKKGKSGFCGQRKNINGKLSVPKGFVSSLAFDPIEKKPIYHFMPSRPTLSFGALGCNFTCPYCQNHSISKPGDSCPVYPFTADKLADTAVKENIKIAVATYNEPAVFAEWAAEIFYVFRKKIKGAKIGAVSNGYFSEDTLKLWGPPDFINIDLKSFDEDTHRKITGAELKEVLSSIELCLSLGVWTEITTLLVKNLNDSSAEIRKAANYIKSLSSEIPWHITAYRPAYLMNIPATDKQDIEKAVFTAREMGLKHVYGGNVIGDSLGDTFCPSCGKRVYLRRGYLEYSNLLNKGKCPFCSYLLKGVWE